MTLRKTGLRRAVRDHNDESHKCDSVMHGFQDVSLACQTWTVVQACDLVGEREPGASMTTTQRQLDD